MENVLTDSEVRQEVKACIRFYERRGKDWLCAVAFILAKHNGTLGRIIGRDYILIRKRWKEPARA